MGKDDVKRRLLTEDAEELVLRTISGHADSLLRTARRHSLNPDDAQDAYQRGLEIFLRHAERLEPAGAPAWLHVVVKREAMAIRRQRQRLVAVEEPDLDAQPAGREPTADERLLSVDLMSRSAEALQRLKPQELRALWLKAQGHSYNEIGELTGWTYTKVNRCLTEGRRSFLARYADIESGAECERWAPVISAMVDGEATPDQLLALRPHLRNCPACRATLKALQDTSAPIAALLPVPLVVMGAAGAGGHLATNVVMRVFEAIAGGVHDRAAVSVTKMQALLETSTAAKAWAVAASAAAVAGGGYATIEQVAGPGGTDPAAEVRTVEEPAVAPAAQVPVTGAPAAAAEPEPEASPPPPEFAGDPAPAPKTAVDREFGFEDGRSRDTAGAVAASAGEDVVASPTAPRRPRSPGKAAPSTDVLGEFEP